MRRIDTLAISARINKKRCARCGKIAYSSQSEAMTSLQRLVVLRLLEYGEVAEHEAYQCHPQFNPEIWHLTSNHKREQNASVKGKIAAKEWAVDHWA